MGSKKVDPLTEQCSSGVRAGVACIAQLKKAPSATVIAYLRLASWRSTAAQKGQLRQGKGTPLAAALASEMAVSDRLLAPVPEKPSG